MPCTENKTQRPGLPPRPARRLPVVGAAWLLALLAAGCGHRGAPPPAASPPAVLPPVAAAAPRAVPPAGAPPAAMPAPVARPARPARHWDEYRLQAAERIVAFNREITYAGEVPEPLLAIPVLEVELNADGSVRNIQVMRKPRQALDTVQLAINAVRRAAPFGSVSHLPRPWKFTEVFLFNDQRRFKPRSLDL